MSRNSDLRDRLRRTDPVTAARATLGSLVLLNLVALWMVFNPPGGSVSSLSTDMAATQQQIAHKRTNVRKLRAIVDKVKLAREATEKFESEYFLARRTYTSTVVDELGRSAKAAGIREREKSFNVEAIEGADNLQLLTINANYEGNYADLVQFVSMVDRSGRLLILEALQAQPLSAGQGLGIQVKLNAIVREDGSVPPITSLKELQAAIPAVAAPVKPASAAPAPPPPATVAQPAATLPQAISRPRVTPPAYTSRSGDPIQTAPRTPPMRGPARRQRGGEEEVEK